MKAQCGYLLAEKINNRAIGIKTENEHIREWIIEELEQLKRKDPDMDRKLALVPKEEIKEHIGRSPDFSDALLMRMWFEYNQVEEYITSQFKPAWILRK